MGFYLLIACTVVFAGLAVGIGGDVTSFLFYTGLCLTLYEAVVYALCLKGVEVTRQISQTRLMAGERIRVSLLLHRSYLFPYHWLILRDRGELENRTTAGKADFLVPNQNHIVLDYGVYQLQRGRYRFKRVELIAGDLLGIVKRKKVVHQPQTILVYPRIQPVSNWSTIAVNQGSRRQIMKKSKQDLSVVTGLRNYQYGDRLQQIHWKATARGQGIKVKEYEQEVTFEFTFLLDQREQAYKDVSPQIFERAVSLVASLMNQTISQQYPTSLLLTGKISARLKAGRSQEHFVRMLETLVDVKPDGKLPLHLYATHEESELRKKKKIVIITPSLDESLHSFIYEMRRKKIEPEVFWVCDPGASTVFYEKWRKVGIPVWRVDEDVFDLAVRGGERVGQFHSS